MAAAVVAHTIMAVASAAAAVSLASAASPTLVHAGQGLSRSPPTPLPSQRGPIRCSPQRTVSTPTMNGIHTPIAAFPGSALASGTHLKSGAAAAMAAAVARTAVIKAAATTATGAPVTAALHSPVLHAQMQLTAPVTAIKPPRPPVTPLNVATSPPAGARAPTAGLMRSPIIAKASSALADMMAFDVERPTRRLMSSPMSVTKTSQPSVETDSPPTPVPEGAVASTAPLLTDKERTMLASLCTFTSHETNQLLMTFSRFKASGVLSARTFWMLIGRAAPLLAAGTGTQPLSSLQQRLFSIFNTSSTRGLTCAEFLLAVAVLSGRATFMSRATLAFDALDAEHDEHVTIDKVRRLLGDLPAPDASVAHVLFQVQHPGGKVDITLPSLLDGWSRLLQKLSATANTSHVSRHVFETTLATHAAAPILLFPFGIQRELSSLWQL